LYGEICESPVTIFAKAEMLRSEILMSAIPIRPANASGERRATRQRHPPLEKSLSCGSSAPLGCQAAFLQRLLARRVDVRAVHREADPAAERGLLGAAPVVEDGRPRTRDKQDLPVRGRARYRAVDGHFDRLRLPVRDVDDPGEHLGLLGHVLQGDAAIGYRVFHVIGPAARAPLNFDAGQVHPGAVLDADRERPWSGVPGVRRPVPSGQRRSNVDPRAARGRVDKQINCPARRCGGPVRILAGDVM